MLMENKFPKIPAVKVVVERGLYDGTELEISEKCDGCFTYETHIQTDKGVMCIGKIVNQRLPVNVLSYNIKTGNTEYKPIVNWFKNGPTDAWLEVTFESPTKEKCIIVTPNHKVYDGVQFKPICEFAVGDVVYYNTPSLTETQYDILLGSILGDGSLRNMNTDKCPLYSETHGAAQKEYSEFKFAMLRNLMSSQDTHFGQYDANSPVTQKHRIHSRSLNCLREFKYMYKDGQKCISSEFVDKLTPLSLAIWFCDDGSVGWSHKQRPRARISTNGFSLPECEILLRELKRRNINGRLANYGKGYQIELTADGTEELFSVICEYVPKCMDYKLPDEYRNRFKLPVPDFNNLSTFTIKSVRTIIPRNLQRYDIEVADNHNYFAAGILVSNSNFSFIVEQDSALTFRSRNRVLGGGLENGGQWCKAISCITEAHAKAPFEQDFVYFGESMTKHTLNYGVTPPFIGYAVYSRKEERFLADWEMSFTSRDIPVVPTWKIPASTPHVEVMEMVNKISNETSAFGTTGTKREGVVVKNYNTQVFAKYVREEFKEENKKVFGDPQIMPKMDDTDKIVFNYCTPSRIHKHVMSLKDERGYEIGMPMMEHLPVLVEEDILTESIVDIAKRYKGVNFKMMRKHIAHYCVHYLKAMLNWEYDDDIETLHRRVTAQFYTAPRSV